MFESKEALDAFYSAEVNYNDLRNDRAGENLLQKYRYAMFLRQGEFAATVLTTLRAFLGDHDCLRPEDESVMALLSARSECVEWLLDGQPVMRGEPIRFGVDHDVLAWSTSEDKPLAAFRLAAPVELAAHTPRDVIDRLERTIADGGRRDFEKARTLYRLGIEALLPAIGPAAHDVATAPARASGNKGFRYVPKFLAPGE